jgi:hypothetical protein
MLESNHLGITIEVKFALFKLKFIIICLNYLGKSIGSKYAFLKLKFNEKGIRRRRLFFKENNTLKNSLMDSNVGT